MTARRATMYAGAAVLLAAWLAVAGGVPRRPPHPVRADSHRAGTAVLDSVARDVQSQALRLRQRLVAAPAPRGQIRNPFAFAPRAASPTHSGVPRRPTVTAGEVPAAPEPSLVLLGIAEDKVASGLIRTAVIGTDGDGVILAIEGQEVAGRYRVVAVGPDVVELKDFTTGSTRRLSFR